MTQTGTRRFCFPAFKRRIFFAAGLFFDISGTFSDSPYGRLFAALGQLGEDLLESSVAHGGVDRSLLKHGSKISFDGVGTLGIGHTDAGQSGTGIGGEVSTKHGIDVCGFKRLLLSGVAAVEHGPQPRPVWERGAVDHGRVARAGDGARAGAGGVC